MAYSRVKTIHKGLIAFLLAFIPFMANFLLEILPPETKSYAIFGIITVEAILVALKNYFKNRGK